MTRYRKVSVQVWNDQKVCEFSLDGKLMWLFLITHPQLTAIGAMRGSLAGLAAELGMPEKRFRIPFEQAMRCNMVEYDPKASFIALPNFLDHNKPESPNVVRGWEGSLEHLPECEGKRLLLIRVRLFVNTLSKAFQEALPKAFQEALPDGSGKTIETTRARVQRAENREQRTEGDSSGKLVPNLETTSSSPTPLDNTDDDKAFLERVRQMVQGIPYVENVIINPKDTAKCRASGISLAEIDAGCWLGVGRHLTSSSAATPIRAFSFFIPVIEEIHKEPPAPGYLEYVKEKLRRRESMVTA